MAVAAKFSPPDGDYRTTAQSATAILKAAFDTDSLGPRPNGVYMNGSSVGDVGPEAKDARKCERLWVDSLGYAGVGEGDTVLAGWR